ncbi:hypothetical protein GQ54DRAFT_212632 [Martensiomyces pterosporus]|nr:hypothetical protein GQ54DRAFT_212632 [Martensiomyces pterosporus]
MPSSFRCLLIERGCGPRWNSQEHVYISHVLIVGICVGIQTLSQSRMSAAPESRFIHCEKPYSIIDINTQASAFALLIPIVFQCEIAT